MVRKDQEKKSEFERIKYAIQSGLESGVSDESVDEIWKRAEEAAMENPDGSL